MRRHKIQTSNGNNLELPLPIFNQILSIIFFHAAAEFGVPVVQTLHNYRTICPGVFLMRDGKICEVCVKPLLRNVRKLAQRY
jgi:hypothetical protein